MPALRYLSWALALAGIGAMIWVSRLPDPYTGLPYVFWLLGLSQVVAGYRLQRAGENRVAWMNWIAGVVLILLGFRRW